jgi:hypothetical protein
MATPYVEANKVLLSFTPKQCREVIVPDPHRPTANTGQPMDQVEGPGNADDRKLDRQYAMY